MALESQVAELQSICKGLSDQVQHLTALVEARTCKNLLEAVAVRDKKAPSRSDFRPTAELIGDHQVSHTAHLDSDTLAQLAISGDRFAQRERLVREIMRVDGSSWDEAHETLIEIDRFNEKPYWLQTFPYRLGICAALFGGAASVFLVFDKSVATLYAEYVAGEDLPDGFDHASAMTINQIGTWTWSWMEPMIGTASFVLLCLQFARAQSIKMNVQPFTEMMLKWRGMRTAGHFHQYDAAMVRQWAMHLPKVGCDFMPKYRSQLYTPEMRTKNYRGA